MNLHLWFDRFSDFGLSVKRVIILILLPLVATLSEVVGLGIFLPIFQYIRLDGDMNALISDSSLWQYIVGIFHYFNIKVSLLVLLLISFTLFLGRQLLSFVRLIYSSATTQYLVQLQRNRLFDQYIEADTSYHDSVPVGSLVNIIVREVDGAISGLMGPMELLTYVLMFVGYLIVLSFLSLEMTLYAVTAIAIASFIPKSWITKSAIVGRKLVDANIIMSRFLVGRLISPRLVRLSGTESAEKQEFHRLTFKQRKYHVSGSILQSKTESMIEPIIIALSLAFLYFSYTVLKLQVEVIGLYLVVLMRLMPVTKSILMKFQSIRNSMGSIEALENRFAEMKESIEQDNGVKTLNKLQHSILFDKVNYYYSEGDDHALKNIDIEFIANKMTAIVGPSGSGKSTLIDLLPRLRSPKSGIVYIGGVNIEEFELKSLRKLISYAPQSPHIFDGTVKNHILYGRSGATTKEVHEAIRLAGADNFISKLPQGINTYIGDNAVKLSGGQRQRLDLARVLITNADVLILDEPTSNLDAESEEIFNKSLAYIRKNTNITIIVVSHSLSGISNADQIIVLNNGVVESKGSHDEMLEYDGWYSKAWKMQNSHKGVKKNG
jgi:ABC-type multidrug transport system fused ATPase/permease subunit